MKKKKKTDKDNYHIPNLYRPISLSNIMGNIYEKIILQEAVSLFTESKFFDRKNVYAYQKSKNAPQALLSLIERVSEAIASGKCGFLLLLT